MAQVAGLHAASIAPNVDLDLITTTFGLRYTVGPAAHHLSYFGQVMGGEANGFHSVFPTPAGAISSTNGLALLVGGGVNATLSPDTLHCGPWMRSGCAPSCPTAARMFKITSGLEPESSIASGRCGKDPIRDALNVRETVETPLAAPVQNCAAGH